MQADEKIKKTKMGKNIVETLFILLLSVFTVAVASAQTKVVSVAGNEFALELYGRLAKNEGNLFFSPTSIHTALGMTYAGAKDQTATQMAKILHFEKTGQDIHAAFAALIEKLNTPRMVKFYERVGDKIKKAEKPAYQLVIANALWGQKGYPWKQGFMDLTAANYGAGLHEVDFARHTEVARKTINAWVESKTQDRIKDLIAQGGISTLTRLILTNAIFFKAEWARKFPDHVTEEMPFHVSATKQIVTTIMSQKDDFRYMETDTFQVLEMPYKAEELSMVVFLPKKIDGLGYFEKTLTPEKLTDWLDKLSIEEVEVFFPKFEFSSRFILSSILKAMGMEDAFSPTSANFSGMTTAENVFVSEVIHKAFVAVDEEGTTAAAATAVMLAGTAMPVPKPEPKIFKADHPFVFSIRHNATGAILFMGRFSDPKTN